MKVYRVIAQVSYPGLPTEAYHSPFVTCFNPALCNMNKATEFGNECKLLYCIHVLTPTLGEEGDIEKIEVSYKIKSLTIHPFKDLYNRVKAWFEYRL